MPRRERPPATPYQQALGLLVRREHSATELARKLRQRGVAESDVAASLAALQQQGFQDDGRFAGVWARSRAAAGQGPARIRAELQQRGIPADQAQVALAGIEADWAAEARRLAARRLAVGPRDAAHRRRVVGFLCRRGFPLGMAVDAVQGVVGAPEDDDFSGGGDVDP